MKGNAVGKYMRGRGTRMERMDTNKGAYYVRVIYIYLYKVRVYVREAEDAAYGCDDASPEKKGNDCDMCRQPTQVGMMSRLRSNCSQSTATQR